MNKRKEYLIPFVGLKIGTHRFDYSIDNAFFEIFDYDEFQKSDIQVTLEFEKKASLLELTFSHNGTINVPCDISGEDFDLPINGKIKLIVRFGDEYNDDNEELLILPYTEYQINVAQYIYEMIVLSVPQKRIHPGIEDGSLQTESIAKLDEISVSEIKEEKEEDEEENIDPRWAKLKQLLTDK